MPSRFADFGSKRSIQVECVFVKFLIYCNKLLFYNNLRDTPTLFSNSPPRLNPKQTPCLYTHLTKQGLDASGFRQRCRGSYFRDFAVELSLPLQTAACCVDR